jgi:hypothetical protein
MNIFSINRKSDNFFKDIIFVWSFFKKNVYLYIKYKRKIMGNHIIQRITHKGTPGFWEIIDGVLPVGLEINPETGDISGYPKEYGDFEIRIRFSNDCGSVEKDIIVRVCTSPEIMTGLMTFVIEEEDGELKVFAGGLPQTTTPTTENEIKQLSTIIYNAEKGRKFNFSAAAGSIIVCLAVPLGFDTPTEIRNRDWGYNMNDEFQKSNILVAVDNEMYEVFFHYTVPLAFVESMDLEVTL